MKSVEIMTRTILKKFKNTLPEIYQLAIGSSSEELFFQKLRILANSQISSNQTEQIRTKALLIKEMLSYESKEIKELSRDEKITIESFSLLWAYLNKRDEGERGSIDLYEDLFQILSLMMGREGEKRYSRTQLDRDMRRWQSGLDRELQEKRVKSRERIIELLIEKIERRGSSSSRFKFEEGITTEEKRELVNRWWGDFRFHLVMAIKNPKELNHFLGESLTTRQMNILNRAKAKKIPFFVTPYYLSLLSTEHRGFDDLTLRSYIFYTNSLVETYGDIKAWEREDMVVDGEPNAAGWLLPNGENIHRRYPEVAIMIPDTRGRSCGGLCASCQRMYDFQSERLNFDMDALKPKESWNDKLIKLMRYFEEDSRLRDILITGGDALMSSNRALERILNSVLKMAKNKREANRSRADGEKYYELERVRLGSRILAYLPMRINSELIGVLKKFRERGEEVGIKQFVIQTHFQTPLEVTVEARVAIEALINAGWVISNQLVFNAAASRRGHTAKLREVLNSLGVVTYYTFSVKGFEENSEVYAPISRSVQEQFEEKSYGKMSREQIAELNQIFIEGNEVTKRLNSFMKRENLPFLPTDRNVLNLPAVGKSNTFRMVGISHDGKRILRFEHDKTREHSPIVDKLGEVYIIENRSILSYLKELERMGEKREEYRSIWSYTDGETERVFPLFDYPTTQKKMSSKITNFKMR